MSVYWKRIGGTLFWGGVAALYYGLLLHQGFYDDEGEFLQWGYRVFQGETIFRDFWNIYLGGIHYYHALLFHCFGVSLQSLRFGLYGASVLFIGMYYELCRVLLKPVWAHAVTALCLFLSVPLFFFVTPNWYAVFLLTVVFYCLWKAYQRNYPPGWVFLTGLLLGITALFKQSIAVYAYLGCLWVPFLQQPMETALPKRSWQRVLCYGLGGGVVLNILLWWGLQGTEPNGDWILLEMLPWTIWLVWLRMGETSTIIIQPWQRPFWLVTLGFSIPLFSWGVWLTTQHALMPMSQQLPVLSHHFLQNNHTHYLVVLLNIWPIVLMVLLFIGVYYGALFRFPAKMPWVLAIGLTLGGLFLWGTGFSWNPVTQLVQRVFFVFPMVWMVMTVSGLLFVAVQRSVWITRYKALWIQGCFLVGFFELFLINLFPEGVYQYSFYTFPALLLMVGWLALWAEKYWDNQSLTTRERCWQRGYFFAPWAFLAVMGILIGTYQINFYMHPVFQPATFDVAITDPGFSMVENTNIYGRYVPAARFLRQTGHSNDTYVATDSPELYVFSQKRNPTPVDIYAYRSEATSHAMFAQVMKNAHIHYVVFEVTRLPLVDSASIPIFLQQFKPLVQLGAVQIWQRKRSGA